MNPLDFDALRKTIHTTSGNRKPMKGKSMKVYIVQRESMVGNEVDCFTDPKLAHEWATIVRSHVQVEETMDDRLPEFIETYTLRTYYECGICGHNHPIEWNGDCRDDANRFTNQQLDEKHPNGWLAVDMPT